jgi:hypothetical protein
VLLHVRLVIFVSWHLHGFDLRSSVVQVVHCALVSKLVQYFSSQVIGSSALKATGIDRALTVSHVISVFANCVIYLIKALSGVHWINCLICGCSSIVKLGCIVN